MEFVRTAIPDVVLIKPTVHGDHRGYFVETFRQDALASFLGFSVAFCQDNESKSSKGVLRGLHYQLPPFAQTKLVRVIQGSVLDIALDIRQGSPTFGRHVSVCLSEANKHQLLVPRGFAHGFVVLEEETVFAYKVDNYYSPENDRGIAYNDPNLGIDWQLPHEALKLSAKDTTQPSFNEAKDFFSYGVNYYG
ncbi:dTDP-4-dehydrorhamnose 3,5-epimerase [Sulfurospirillum sp. T05]|jgi:dTDP-4-dehydrorhamnose 3,5-epimerase|uniref:dTDP-4-dehydrorhamnose 3,5-epimerase n=2 Tax=Sulfurospirillum tamanense TaxID=2813362 RepID=A0ABS2WSQ7_9BACT|nr:dTDP-4-dehydrorhamnose 3,5-epimerase [Sulfurospirillum tamanensis]MBE0497403.1 dTDP-4-dehydrorhamnose 3,5-epimerase [Campylobacterales bacterium]MBN2964656.1 dTDP-4-dehydrorhamnose 3,5-epimerase [Sulfurospirillum tamanensis]